jgi:hypothetical protein
MLSIRGKLILLFMAFYLTPGIANAQLDHIDSTWVADVKISVDKPLQIHQHWPTIIDIFSLPNGNSTEQTMGKKMQPGDDWHFDIQHIRAQTIFIRKRLKHRNFIVIYMENAYKSWPLWKQNHPDYAQRIPRMVDSLYRSITSLKKTIYLNSHSGGGSFIFGYLAGVDPIPAYVKRIGFIDSDYGYDSTYTSKILHWLDADNNARLSVFAYNDSIVIYNGKPLVSPTGGTWYRSHLMLQHLSENISFSKSQTDSLIIYKSADRKVQFYFKINVDRGIYHTQQVELNGFIHSTICGTKQDSKGYVYYGKRAYSEFIE